jgi:hypothetical protein
MNIIEIDDEDANFIWHVYEQKDNYDSVIIPLNVKDLQLRVIDCDYRYYLALEEIKSEYIIGAVELIKRQYKELTNVFEPHSYIKPAFRGKGYIYSLYVWILNNGFTLVCGHNQTKCSEGLWNKLSKHFQFKCYDWCEETIIDYSDDLDLTSLRKVLRKVN